MEIIGFAVVIGLVILLVILIVQPPWIKFFGRLPAVVLAILNSVIGVILGLWLSGY